MSGKHLLFIRPLMNFSLPVISLPVTGKTSRRVTPCFNRQHLKCPVTRGRLCRPCVQNMLNLKASTCFEVNTDKSQQSPRGHEVEHEHAQHSQGRHPNSPRRHQSGGQGSTLLLPTTGPQRYQTLALQHQISFRVLYLFTSGSFPLVSSSRFLHPSHPAAGGSACSLTDPARLCTAPLAPPSYSQSQSSPGSRAPQPHVRGF